VCRHFAQDDAHVFCTEDQIPARGSRRSAVRVRYLQAVSGSTWTLELSTRPEDRIGSDELWDKSEEALINALDDLGLQYTINEGDGAFYGPKIDMHMTDSLGRSWQLGTCQLDYNSRSASTSAIRARTTQSTAPVMIHRGVDGLL